MRLYIFGTNTTSKHLKLKIPYTPHEFLTLKAY